MSLLGCKGRVLWGSQAKAGIGQFTTKGLDFLSPTGTLSKAYTRVKALGGRGNLITRATGKSYQKLTFACGSVGCCLKHVPP